MNQQVRDFVDGITADNLSDYFEIVKDKIVLPKLSGAKLLNAKFVYCLY